MLNNLGLKEFKRRLKKYVSYLKIYVHNEQQWLRDEVDVISV